VTYDPPKAVASVIPPQYEFRGRSVENGIEYFSLYNLETKKAFWAGMSGGGELRVQAYDPAGGLVLADRSGRTIRLALKDTRTTGGGIPLRPGTALAAAPANGAPLARAVSHSATESQRLEQVADQIRARRAQRKQTAG